MAVEPLSPSFLALPPLMLSSVLASCLPEVSRNGD
jgi:hypothetical protein